MRRVPGRRILSPPVGPAHQSGSSTPLRSPMQDHGRPMVLHMEQPPPTVVRVETEPKIVRVEPPEPPPDAATIEAERSWERARAVACSLVSSACTLKPIKTGADMVRVVDHLAMVPSDVHRSMYWRSVQFSIMGMSARDLTTGGIYVAVARGLPDVALFLLKKLLDAAFRGPGPGVIAATCVVLAMGIDIVPAVCASVPENRRRDFIASVFEKAAIQPTIPTKQLLSIGRALPVIDGRHTTMPLRHILAATDAQNEHCDVRMLVRAVVRNHQLGPVLELYTDDDGNVREAAQRPHGPPIPPHARLLRVELAYHAVAGASVPRDGLR